MPVDAVLVTAFEPFGGEGVNASWEAAKRIDGVRCGRTVATALLLPCVYEACVADLLAAVERLKPCALVMTGQAARRSVVSVERLARNRAHPTARDNRGALGRTAPDGPDLVATAAPANALARAIRAAGVPARVSTDAGDYVCNHLYYNALRRLDGSGRPAPAVFIHLPATPEQIPDGAGPRGLATDDAARALRAAVAFMAAEARRGLAADLADVGS